MIDATTIILKRADAECGWDIKAIAERLDRDSVSTTLPHKAVIEILKMDHRIKTIPEIWQLAHFMAVNSADCRRIVGRFIA